MYAYRSGTFRRTWRFVRLFPRNLALYFSWFAISFFSLLPVIWGFSTSFKGLREIYLSPSASALLPKHPTLANYRFIFTLTEELPVQFKNSTIVTLSSVALTVLLASLMGYAFARMNFRGRDFIFYSLIVLMFIPRAGGLMAQYEMMAFLHLRNSLLGLILAFSSHLSVPVFIMRQTFLSLPRELEESAFIDGASRWQVFFRIALPLGTGGMIICAVLKFVDVWGDYLFTLTMVDMSSLYTIGIGITMMFSDAAQYVIPETSGAGVQSAGYLLVSWPVMLLFITLQKWFIRGMREGVLKF